MIRQETFEFRARRSQILVLPMVYLVTGFNLDGVPSFKIGKTRNWPTRVTGLRQYFLDGCDLLAFLVFRNPSDIDWAERALLTWTQRRHKPSGASHETFLGDPSAVLDQFADLALFTGREFCKLIRPDDWSSV